MHCKHLIPVLYDSGNRLPLEPIVARQSTGIICMCNRCSVTAKEMKISINEALEPWLSRPKWFSSHSSDQQQFSLAIRQLKLLSTTLAWKSWNK